MTNLPDWYQIPRAEAGINVRPSGTQDDTNQPPFTDLFNDSVPRVIDTITQMFGDFVQFVYRAVDTVIDWAAAFGIDLSWLRGLVGNILDGATWQEWLEAFGLGWVIPLILAIQKLLDWLFNPLAGSPNLLLDPEFDYAKSIGNDDWVFDEDVAYGASPSRNSRRVPADGTARGARSNVVSLAGIDELEARLSVAFGPSVVLADGAAVLSMVTFNDGVETGLVELDRFKLSMLAGVPPGATPRFGPADAWIGVPLGSIAGELYGRWVVPAGVDEACLRVEIEASGGGFVWVDHGRLAQHGGFFGMILAIIEAVRLFFGAVWTAVMRWLFGVQDGSPFKPPPEEDFEFPEPNPSNRYDRIDPAHYGDPFSVPMWDWMCQYINTAWHVMVNEILDVLGIEMDSLPDFTAVIRDFLTENPVVGWLFKIGFAVTDWVGELWTAVMRWIFGVASGSPYYDPYFIGTADDKKPFSSALWNAIIIVCTDGFDVMVIHILEALGFETPTDGVDRSLSNIIKSMLIENPFVGWLFKIGFAVSDYLTEVFDSIMDWVFGGFTSALWSSMQTRMNTAWSVLVAAIEDALNKTFARKSSPNDLIGDFLRNNPLFGWLFDMIDAWLQPVLKVGKAVIDFGDACWKAVTTFVANMSSSTAWQTMIDAINSAWTVMVNAILAAWGSSKTAANFASPATATDAALRNNPVTGWLFRGSGLAAAFTKLSDAIWDYLLGGSRYNGVNRAAWSTAAGANLETAWRAFWAQITGSPASQAPTPGSAGAQGLWNGISSSFIRSALTGVWQPLGDLQRLISDIMNVVKAGWDSLFGTHNYPGTFTTAWSNLMVTLGWSSAPTTTIGQVGSAAATKVLTGIFAPPTVADDITNRFNNYISQIFGKWTAGSNTTNVLAANAGQAITTRIPSAVMANSVFTGNGVTSVAGGGLRFQTTGWYTFIISIYLAATSQSYTASCLLLDSSSNIFLEGQAYANPNFATSFSPVLQCNGLVNITNISQTYYPAYSVTNTIGGAVYFNGAANSGQLYISATKLK